MFKKKIFLFAGIFFSYFSYAQQDTISGNHNSLLIKNGTHVIKSVVTVSKSLTIEAGAKIELIEPGVIVCEGSVDITGVGNNIEFKGKKNAEGIGLIIKAVDPGKVFISNAVFTNLQMPLFFDFGWQRNSVTITENRFIKNVGKVSVIQVLNPPFNFNSDTLFSTLTISNNLFADNNGAIYFEDLKSDHLKIEFVNNSIVNNTIYGFKNYNISTNVLYGRVDQFFSKYNAKIEGNSFVGNYLMDNLSDTIVHLANLGLYGTEKNFIVKGNYWGGITVDKISKGFYDQNINYTSPKADFEPWINEPNNIVPTHIFSLKNAETNNEFPDTLIVMEPLKGFVLASNNPLDLSKSVINYTYFLDDTSLKKVDTTVNFDIQAVSTTINKLNVTKQVNANKKLGYYTISNLLDVNKNYVPDTKVGYARYLLDLRKRKILDELIKSRKAADTVKIIPKELDSIKNQFQKIEAPQKSRFEFGLYGGGSIFTGTISNSNIFNNEMNMLFGLNVNYTLYSNLSASLYISSSKLSNSDYNSSNNEQIARGMSFSTSILSISPSINYDYIDNRLYTKARRIRPSVGFGFDMVSFSPTGLYKGKEYNLQTLGTGGQLVDSTKAPYSLMALGYFFNFKLKYQLSRFNSVGILFAFHKSLSDYLDDVGPDQYPDISKVLAKTKTDPEAAAYFSNPTARFINQGQVRSSPSNPKDSYITFGFFYSRRLFK